jgi:hypothetical protein
MPIRYLRVPAQVPGDLHEPARRRLGSAPWQSGRTERRAAGRVHAIPWQIVWSRQRAAGHASPAITPVARRQARNKFWWSAVLTINGMLLILSAHSGTAARIGVVTGSALLFWMLGALFM